MWDSRSQPRKDWHVANLSEKLSFHQDRESSAAIRYAGPCYAIALLTPNVNLSIPTLCCNFILQLMTNKLKKIIVLVAYWRFLVSVLGKLTTQNLQVVATKINKLCIFLTWAAIIGKLHQTVGWTSFLLVLIGHVFLSCKWQDLLLRPNTTKACSRVRCLWIENDVYILSTIFYIIGKAHVITQRERQYS